MVLLFEESERGNRIVNSIFPKAQLHRVINDQKQEIPLEGYFLPKSGGEAGLEVADFVIHTAGANVRDRLKGRKDNRKDFEIIFNQVDQNLVSYLEIGSVVAS
jgi:hypothetical protein